MRFKCVLCEHNTTGAGIYLLAAEVKTHLAKFGFAGLPPGGFVCTMKVLKFSYAPPSSRPPSTRNTPRYQLSRCMDAIRLSVMRSTCISWMWHATHQNQMNNGLSNST